jgi:hypothetical protein
VTLSLCRPFDGQAASAGNGAYVRDPDGNKLAAYCQGFTQSRAKADIRRAHSALK